MKMCFDQINMDVGSVPKVSGKCMRFDSLDCWPGWPALSSTLRPHSRLGRCTQDEFYAASKPRRYWVLPRSAAVEYAKKSIRVKRPSAGGNRHRDVRRAAAD